MIPRLDGYQLVTPGSLAEALDDLARTRSRGRSPAAPI